MAKSNHPNKKLATTQKLALDTELRYPSDVGAIRQKPLVLFKIKPGVGPRSEVAKKIALYMPTSVKVSYGAEYEQFNLLGKQYKEGLRTLISNIQQAYQNRSIEGKPISDASAVAGSILGPSFGGELLLNSRKILNPMMATIFRGIGFREFTFDYHFMARNREESDTIRKIVQFFKYHMHPSPEDGTEHSTFWYMPEVFDIQFHSSDVNASGSTYLFKLKDTVLKNFDVDYTSSGGQMAFFTSGAPVDIRCSLTFAETKLVTKADILDGH